MHFNKARTQHCAVLFSPYWIIKIVYAAALTLNGGTFSSIQSSCLIPNFGRKCDGGVTPSVPHCKVITWVRAHLAERCMCTAAWFQQRAESSFFCKIKAMFLKFRHPPLSKHNVLVMTMYVTTADMQIQKKGAYMTLLQCSSTSMHLRNHLMRVPKPLSDMWEVSQSVAVSMTTFYCDM